MVFVPFSQNSFGATGYFQSSIGKLYQQPTICIFQPDDVRVDENRWKIWFADSKVAVDEWETILKQRATSTNEKWNIEVVEILLDRQHQYNSAGCNIEVHFTILPSEFGVLGWYWIGTGIIEIVTTQSEYCGKKYFPEYGLNFQVYCYKDTLERSKKMAAVLKHELGHAFGLGHYVTSDSTLLESWQNNPLGQPSIMTFAHHNEEQMRIQAIDIKKLQEIHGGSGFGKTKNTNLVFEQELTPEVYIIPKKITPTSERPSEVTLSILVGGNNFGSTVTVNEGETIQLSGKVMDYYGNAMPNQYVSISEIGVSGSLVTDYNGEFSTSWVAKHNQNNMGMKRSTWNPIASVSIPYGSVQSAPANIFIPKTDYSGSSSTISPIFSNKIILYPSLDKKTIYGTLTVQEGTDVILHGKVTDQIGKPVYNVKVFVESKLPDGVFVKSASTNPLGGFSVKWPTSHNFENYDDGKSVWNFYAYSTEFYEKLESSIVQVTVTDPPLQISDVLSSKTYLDNAIKEVEEGTVISEQSLTELTFDKKEAQDKINLAWDYLKENKIRIDNLYSDYLKNIQDYIDINNPEGVKAEIDRAYSSVSYAEDNLLKISKLIEGAKELEIQKICFLFWCF